MVFFCFFVDGMGVTTKMAATGGWDGEDDKWDQILWFCIQHYFSLLPYILERERERRKVGVSFLKRKVAVLDKLLINGVMAHGSWSWSRWNRGGVEGPRKTMTTAIVPQYHSNFELSNSNSNSPLKCFYK